MNIKKLLTTKIDIKTYLPTFCKVGSKVLKTTTSLTTPIFTKKMTVKLLKISPIVASGVTAGLLGCILAFKAIPTTYTAHVSGINFWEFHLIEDTISKLEMADSNDTVVIHVNSPGGLVGLGFLLINAMDNSEATVEVKVEMIAFSMGGLIAVSGDSLTVNKMSSFLFHRPYMIDQNGDKVLADETDPAYIMAQRFMEREVFQYLTTSEIALYNTGGDVIIDGQDFIKRTKNVKSGKPVLDGLPKEGKLETGGFGDIGLNPGVLK